MYYMMYMIYFKNVLFINLMAFLSKNNILMY